MSLCCKRKFGDIEIASLCGGVEVTYPHCHRFDEWLTLQDSSRSSDRDKKEETGDNYKSNALLAWPTIYAKLKQKNRQIAVFLDYDGTLTPIVDTPSKAVLTSSMREVIQRLSEKFATAIVTGRKIETIYKFVQLNSLHYAGSHGFDIRGAQNSRMKQIATDFRPYLQQSYQVLSDKMKEYPGTLVEDNDFSISVHFRKVKPELVPKIEQEVDQQIAACPKLIKKFGKKVFEIRPQIDWDKGKAVKWLLQSMFQGKKRKKKRRKPLEVIPIYIGDDLSDEDAFRELKSYENSISIHVKGKKDRPTAASYVLRDPSEVETFLLKLTQL